MDIHRATWNKQQQILKSALAHPEQQPECPLYDHKYHRKNCSVLVT